MCKKTNIRPQKRKNFSTKALDKLKVIRARKRKVKKPLRQKFKQESRRVIESDLFELNLDNFDHFE